MDALQLIKQQLDVETILEHYDFDNARASGNKMRACCKLHDGDNPNGFVIDLDNGLWSCHTGDCGNGDIFHLVQRLEDISFPLAVHKIAEIMKLEIGDLEIVARNKKEQRELKEFLKAIKQMQKKELEEFVEDFDKLRVTKYKAFQTETIQKFGLVLFKEFFGMKTNGDPMVLRDRLGFPIVHEGKLIGYSLRSTKIDDVPKWVHQPTHIKTSEMLYNYDVVIGASKVVVCEGITDVWAFDEIGIKAIATYGAKISDEQRKMLLRLGCDLVFAFDGDEAGRIAQQKAYEMFYRTTNIEFINFATGEDPESIDREALSNYYKTKTRKVGR